MISERYNLLFFFSFSVFGEKTTFKSRLFSTTVSFRIFLCSLYASFINLFTLFLQTALPVFLKTAAEITTPVLSLLLIIRYVALIFLSVEKTVFPFEKISTKSFLLLILSIAESPKRFKVFISHHLQLTFFCLLSFYLPTLFDHFLSSFFL